MRKLGFAAAIFAAAVVVSLASRTYAQSPGDTPTCDGLSGAAWGLCNAAMAIGCADATIETLPACIKIEDSYTRITGEQPVWLNPCPCAEEQAVFANIVNGVTAIGTCETFVSEQSEAVFVWQGLPEEDGKDIAGSIVWPSIPSFNQCASGTWPTTDLLVITEEEAKNCNRLLFAAASKQGVACTAR